MDTIYSPIEVMNANCFHKFTAGTMKEHLFINLRHASFFLELSLFPKNTIHTGTKHTEKQAISDNYKFSEEPSSTQRVKQKILP